MARQEARLRLSSADQRRVAMLGSRYGWSGFALTVWLLAGELDGVPVEDGLAWCELVAQVTAGPGHDPTVRRSADGTRYTLAVADVPGPVLIGPLPGKDTSTMIVPPPSFEISR